MAQHGHDAHVSGGNDLIGRVQPHELQPFVKALLEKFVEVTFAALRNLQEMGTETSELERADTLRKGLCENKTAHLQCEKHCDN